MSTNDRNSKGSNQLGWLLIPLVVAIPIGFFIPFPLSMLVYLIVVLGMGYLRFSYVMKKAGINNFRQMFRVLSNSQNRYQPLRYYCMNCGNEHRDISCPKCGSKVKRVG
ncbi:MAG TPA: hypothetical protein VH415_06150 [Nitrososphaeraceae archaeon]|jgi:hypothetical protein